MQGPSGSTNQWDEYAERLRAQLPAAPDSLMDIYVKWAPIIAMIFGGLGVVISLGILFLGAIFAPFMVLAGASGMNAGMSLVLATAMWLVSSLLDLVGGYFMYQRLLTGWWLVAVGLVVGALHSLVSFNVLGLIFTVLIAYIHLMVKPRYH